MAISNILHLVELMTTSARCYPPKVHTLQFTLGVVHSVGLDERVMICTRRYGPIQTFTALKTEVANFHHSTHGQLEPWQRRRGKLTYFRLAVPGG